MTMKNKDLNKEVQKSSQKDFDLSINIFDASK